jgi:hypothetical protein
MFETKEIINGLVCATLMYYSGFIREQLGVF